MNYLLENPIVFVLILTIATGLFYAGRWTGNVNTDRENFKNFMKEIRDKIDKIFERLPAPPPIATSSPLQLTDFGEKISACADGKNAADAIANEIVQQAEGMNPYQIQEFSKEYMKNTFEPTPDQFTKFGNCAYEHGVKYDQVLEVIAIELRDRLLKLAKPHYNSL